MEPTRVLLCGAARPSIPAASPYTTGPNVSRSVRIFLKALPSSGRRFPGWPKRHQNRIIGERYRLRWGGRHRSLMRMGGHAQSGDVASYVSTARDMMPLGSKQKQLTG